MFAKRVIIGLVMLAAIVSCLSCKGGSDTFTSHIDLAAQQTSLEEVGTLIDNTVPIPTYLPEGYQIREIYVETGDDPTEKADIILLISDEEIGEKKLVSQETQQCYEFQSKMEIRITWNRQGIVGGLKIPEGKSMPISENGEHIAYERAILVDHGDYNNLIYLFAPTPGKPQFWIVLSANKDISERELVKVAQSSHMG